MVGNLLLSHLFFRRWRDSSITSLNSTDKLIARKIVENGSQENFDKFVKSGITKPMADYVDNLFVDKEKK